MNGEVVHALFRLLQQRVAEGFPGEVFGNAVHLLQRLINRDGANRYRAVTQDPFAGFVNIAASGEIHYRVRAPARGPDQLLHLFFDGGGDGRVTDVSVDLHQEVAADNHRLGFRVVDVGGDNRAACGHFVTHKLRRDVLRQASAKAFTRMLIAQHFATDALATHVFADGDELHLRRDDAPARVVQLGHAFARFSAFWRQQAGKAQLVQTVVGQALFGVSRAQHAQLFAVVARVNPRLAQLSQTLLDVDGNIRVTVRAGGVVYRHGFVVFILRVIFAAADKRRAELNFAHWDADIGLRAGNVDAFRVRESGAFQRVNEVLGLCALFAAGQFCSRHSSFQK